MMTHWPARIDYGVTLHPERTAGYIRARKQKSLGGDFEVWAHRNSGAEFKHRTTTDWAGSSGLLAVKVAIEQGFTGIVLAGVPLEDKFGHISRKKIWTSAKLFRNGWNHHTSELKPIVRSMSGWTATQFGTPDTEWLSNLKAGSPDLALAEVIEANFLTCIT